MGAWVCSQRVAGASAEGEDHRRVVAVRGLARRRSLIDLPIDDPCFGAGVRKHMVELVGPLPSLEVGLLIVVEEAGARVEGGALAVDSEVAVIAAAGAAQ